MASKRKFAEDNNLYQQNNNHNGEGLQNGFAAPPTAKRFRPTVGASSSSLQPPSSSNAPPPASTSSSSSEPFKPLNLPDMTNQVDNGLKRARKRGRPNTWDEATPTHKNARTALYGILKEAGMLPSDKPSGIETPPMISHEAALHENHDPEEIVLYTPNAHALATGSNNPTHLERLAQLMASPQLISELYKEFCSRLAKPVDITAAWIYFVSELASYAHSQCVAAGRKDVSYDQVEDFIKKNWFTITHANSMALAGAHYDQVFPASTQGAIVLPPTPRGDDQQPNGSSGVQFFPVPRNLNNTFESPSFNIPGSANPFEQHKQSQPLSFNQNDKENRGPVPNGVHHQNSSGSNNNNFDMDIDL